jgi:ubiquinone/menaquinone biosynthesis C-methylase UbiE
MSKEIGKKEVLEANIAYHRALAETYDAKQPHYLPENRARVEAILAEMGARTKGGGLLDLGCGTGFIINLAKKYFTRLVGVDITQDMLTKVDKRGGHVELFQADTSDLSFLAADSFDVCTAYGFLHHLFDLEPTLREAYRCLKPGGYFYSEQDPNFHYWQLMKSLSGRTDLPEMTRREVLSVVEVAEVIASETGLSQEEIGLAEFQKVTRGGFEADAIASIFKKVGFSSVQYRYEWFLGQGNVIHQKSPEEAETVEAFLRTILPASRQLFKYISFYAQK